MPVQTIPKHPTSPDKTLDEVLHDVVERNAFDRKLVRYDITPTSVVLTYQEPV